MPVNALLPLLHTLQSKYHNYFILIQDQGAAIAHNNQDKLDEVNGYIASLMKEITAFQNETQIIKHIHAEMTKLKEVPKGKMKHSERRLVSTYAGLTELIQKIQRELQHNIEQQKIATQAFKERSDETLEKVQTHYIIEPDDNGEEH